MYWKDVILFYADINKYEKLDDAVCSRASHYGRKKTLGVAKNIGYHRGKSMDV